MSKSNVIGFVDGAAAGEIFGWAMDRSSPDGPVFLNVSVSGRFGMTIGTFEYRPDVAVAFGNHGMNGFRFRLPEHLLSGPVVDISITSENGDHLVHTPFQVARTAFAAAPARLRRGHESCVLFMHIQRTSGTAFREAIEPNYCGSERIYYYPTPPGIWHERFETLPAQQLATFKFVAGHFVFGVHTKIDAPCEYITVVRDPVERLVSNYFLAVRRKAAEITAGGEILALEEVLERQLSAEFDNLTVRCFGGYGERECPRIIGPEEYEAAVENVRRFRFISDQKKPEEGWTCMRRIFGWQHGNLERVNVGRPEDHIISDRARKAIEYYCRYDIRFYKENLRPLLSGAE